MNPNLRILLLSINACLITIGLMIFIDYLILEPLGDFTLRVANKYLVFNWTTLDRNLVRWFPLLIGLVMIIVSRREDKVYFKTLSWTVLSVVVSVIVGIIVALLTWHPDSEHNSLLPEYIKYQPFEYYWTIFIAVAILLPLTSVLACQKNKTARKEMSDKKEV